MSYLCAWAAAGTSVALTCKRTSAISHKYICRSKSSLSNMRKSQLTLVWFAILGWKKCHIFPPASKPCALKPTSWKWQLQKGKQSGGFACFWQFFMLSYGKEDSHHRAHSRTWEERAHLTHLASDKPLHHTPQKTRHSAKQHESCLSLFNQSQAWDSYILADTGSYQTSTKLTNTRKKETAPLLEKYVFPSSTSWIPSRAKFNLVALIQQNRLYCLKGLAQITAVKMYAEGPLKDISKTEKAWQGNHEEVIRVLPPLQRQFPAGNPLVLLLALDIGIRIRCYKVKNSHQHIPA